ncbi:MAG: esterase-like activity of phytase family protein [Luteitalea sp.]|nr:esterase-like activity of phytase family protein [Luteitalea sp.]
MTRIAIGLLCAGLAGSVTSDITLGKGRRESSFHRVGTLANYRNNPNITDETVSEIVAATADGKTLIYTDGPRGEVGFIDITNPASPLPAGSIILDPTPADDVVYEPTSVDVLGNGYALVAANTSQSVFDPSGSLLVIHIPSKTVVWEIDLGGQPDSIQISPDRRFVAVAIENERSETLCVGGRENGLDVVEDDDYVSGVNTTEDLCEEASGVVGGLPQTPFGNPPGYLTVIGITGQNPAAWIRHDVALTGLAEYAPEDPEPEFVDINHRNQAVVTLQENNHVVIVDLARHQVINHFPAGVVTLNGIDATEDDVIALADALANVPREPDAVAWIPGGWGHLNIATANEGDLFGGSRGFSIFTPEGALAFDSGVSLEELAVRHGHYPESRSENKGTEPEAIEYARFRGQEYLFVGSERGSFIAVYLLDRFGRPRFTQLLPAPLGPEGLLAIPHRNLLVASGETDDPSFGVRSTVMIYELTREAPEYPQIVSRDRAGSPIPWSALSGMTSIPGRPDTILAVWDSYFSESRILAIDVSSKPAVITGALTIQNGSGNYDPEGITVAPDDTLWIASEGNASDSRQNLLIQTDLTGQVLTEIGLPTEILACRAASTNRTTLGSGFEGVAVLRGRRGAYRLLVAQQRGWDYTTGECEDLDDDGGGLNVGGEPNWTRIWIYDPQSDSWDSLAWELAPKPANASWVGLSEITETPSGEYLVIERDNLTGDFAELKTLARVDLPATADRLISHTEKVVYDLLPDFAATNGWMTDKPEGVAVTADGHTYVVTDNDGVDDWSGETWFFDLGPYWWLFR